MAGGGGNLKRQGASTRRRLYHEYLRQAVQYADHQAVLLFTAHCLFHLISMLLFFTAHCLFRLTSMLLFL